MELLRIEDGVVRVLELEPHVFEHEYTKYVNFYLNYRPSPTLQLEQLFVAITDEIAKYEQTIAHSNGRRSYDRSAKATSSVCRSVSVLSLNALQIHNLGQQGIHIGIPLDSNFYGKEKRYAPTAHSYRLLKAALDGMVALGYLAIHRKGYFEHETWTGERTRFHGTQRLFDKLREAAYGEEIKLFSDFSEQRYEVIRLRDENKRLADYTDTAFTNSARDNLERINAVLENHSCSLDMTPSELKELQCRLMTKKQRDKEQTLNMIDETAVRLVRIFNQRSFSKGGRFYRGWWQMVPEDCRAKIMIDGEPTIELDYSKCHPTMLYAEKDLVLEGDPYCICPYVSRNDGKVAFNAIINAGAMPKQPEGFSGAIPWEEFVQMMMDHHKLIADRFLTGYGLDLQFKDSQIANAILLELAKQGIACLPIHDSFIVKRQHEPLLEALMKTTFLEHVGTPIEIKRKTSHTKVIRQATEYTLSTTTGVPLPFPVTQNNFQMGMELT